jgi:hypothetical protein
MDFQAKALAHQQIACSMQHQQALLLGRARQDSDYRSRL